MIVPACGERNRDESRPPMPLARHEPFTLGGYNREKHMNREWRPGDTRVRVLYNADTVTSWDLTFSK